MISQSFEVDTKMVKLFSPHRCRGRPFLSCSCPFEIPLYVVREETCSLSAPFLYGHTSTQGPSSYVSYQAALHCLRVTLFPCYSFHKPLHLTRAPLDIS